MTALQGKDNEDSDGGPLGWLSVLGVFLSVFFVKGTNVALGLFFIAFVEYFGEGAGSVSWISTLTLSVTWLGAPFASALAKRFGHRNIVAVGASLAFFALLMGSFATQIWHLAISVGFLSGLAGSFINAPATAFVGFHFRRRHSLAIGLAYSGIGAGSLSLPAFFQFSIEQYGWQGALLVFSAMTANLLVAAALLMKPFTLKRKHVGKVVELRDNPRKTNPEGTINEPVSDKSYIENNISNTQIATSCTTCRTCNSDKARFKSLTEIFDLHVFKNENFVFFAVLFLAFSFGQAISVIHIAPIIDTFGFSKEQTAIALSLYGVGCLCGSPFWGYVLSHCNVSVVHCYSLIIGMYGVCELLVPVATPLLAISTIMVALGFLRGGFSAQTSVVVRRTVGVKHITNAYGWCLLFGGVGQLIGGVTSGYMHDMTGSYDVSFYSAGLLTIFSCLVLSIGTVIIDKRKSRNYQSVSIVYL
ncbi:monocarboxylate transporter 13-like [Saccoglossus kowalevskii]